MNVYGASRSDAAYTGVIPIMLNKIDANEAPSINGDGTQAYDFIDVEDVARCNVCALKSDACDEFYNVDTWSTNYDQRTLRYYFGTQKF